MDQTSGVKSGGSRVRGRRWVVKAKRAGLWSWPDKDHDAARLNCSEFECDASSLLSGGAEFGMSARVFE